MISRTEQNWPEDVTINLVQHNGELKAFGRLLAMKMLLDKAHQLNLSPYAHESSTNGTACAQDCPACRWASEQNKQQA